MPGRETNPRRVRCGLSAVIGTVLMSSGCLFSDSRPSRQWLEQFWGYNGPTGSDVISIEVAVLEQPLADPYLDRQVWESVDEQALSIDQRDLIRDNGLRVGVQGGIVPGELQALLTSEGSNPRPRRYRLRAGSSADLPLLEEDGTLMLDIRPALGESEKLEYDGAELVLRITPDFGEADRVRLHCLPVLIHGESRPWRAPGEGGGFSLTTRRAERALDNLAWSVEVGPSEYALLGTRFAQSKSLGQRALVAQIGDNLIQRLVVIRASGSGGGASRGLPPPSSDAPLALQANYGVAPTEDSR